MFDVDQLPEIRKRIREQTKADATLLRQVLADVEPLKAGVRTIQPRNTNSISLVASDGGNNGVQFNPFYLQMVRVVDSYGRELALDVVSPSTDTRQLAARNLEDKTPLGLLMTDLGVSTLYELSPMISDHPRSKGWTLVYRDLCEWAVLYDLICNRQWGSDTLIVRDGLLRTKIFSGDLFVQMYRRIRDSIEETYRRDKREIFLVGIAKHSEVLSHYKLAMTVADVFADSHPQYAPIPLSIQKQVYEWAEYVRSPEDDQDDKERPKYNMGSMYFVRFGKKSGDPVWTVDLLANQSAKAQKIFGSLLGDAELGFPVPYYPNCLQQADAHAQVVDLDLAILQDTLEDAVREQISAERRQRFDALRLAISDPAARRYA